MVSAAIDALGGGVRADTVQLPRHGWFYLALEARVGPGRMRWIAAYPATLRVEQNFRAANSWVAEAPAEGALGGGCG